MNFMPARITSGVTTTGTIVQFPAIADGHGAFACLRKTGFAENFHFWRGASERRYAASVSMIDPETADASLPAFDGFVLIAVVRSAATRRPIAIAAIERSADRRAAILEAVASGASEWHVHLLGSDRAVRAAIVADLRTRHTPEQLALSA